MKYLRLLSFALSFFPFHHINSQVVDSTFGEPFSYGQPQNVYIPGITACDFDERDDRSYSMLFLDDGRIILAGHTAWDGESDFAFARLLPDGTYDQTAGPDGEVRLDLGYQNDSCLAAVRYQSDKVLMGGCVSLPGQTGYANLLVRTDLDGNLDTSFGNQGQVIIDLPGFREMVTKILPLPGGKIIIAGNVYYGPSYQYPDSTFIFIGRLHPGGQVDSTFGINGFLYQRFSNCNSTLLGDIEIYDDGSVLITGGGYHPYPGIYAGEIVCDPSITLCRYLPDGEPDPGFGFNGVVTLPFTAGRGNALSIYEDGRVLVSGVTKNFSVEPNPIITLIARLLPNGTLDSTFSNDGIFRQYEPGAFGLGSDPVSITITGQDIFVAYHDDPVGSHLTFGILCLNGNGQLNTDFGNSGIFSYYNSYPLTSYALKEMRLSPDKQKLYFGGWYTKLLHKNMMVSRLNISDMNPTAVVERPGTNGMKIYPNPLREGIFYVDLPGLTTLEDFSLCIRDVAGRAILFRDGQFAGHQNKIDASLLANGVYFVELSNRNECYTGKLLVQR
ncbi:MAG: T9SS type A sorting domain-containing protein [Saprospiraceae bacterium]|nr:MAG: T9SS type A sorting domain-containing protein [Saprospiraceae bacterium]